MYFNFGLTALIETNKSESAVENRNNHANIARAVQFIQTRPQDLKLN